MAERFGVDERKLIGTLKATAFSVKNGPEPTNEQMMALMVVADQYGLNPFTREIYAFPDKQNGIVPVVGVDGWSRIINSHADFDGMEFAESEQWIDPAQDVPYADAKPCPTWIECRIYRKDRGHPICAREYLDEVYRPPFEKRGERGPYKVNGPWQSHTKRMLRHKAMIQASRLAMGFAGIYDPDEAERIREARDMGPARVVEDEPAAYPAEDFDRNFPTWAAMIRKGEKTVEDIIAIVESKGTLSAGMVETLRSVVPADQEELA